MKMARTIVEDDCRAHNPRERDTFRQVDGVVNVYAGFGGRYVPKLDGTGSLSIKLVVNVVGGKMYTTSSHLFVSMYDRICVAIDEDTALIVHQNEAEVFGSTYALIYDGGFWSRGETSFNSVPEPSRRYYFLKEGIGMIFGRGRLLNQKEREAVMKSDKGSDCDELYICASSIESENINTMSTMFQVLVLTVR
jgi:hypothetical protein